MAAVAAVVTVNPLRVWPGAPGRSPRQRLGYAVGGALVVLAAVLAVSDLSGLARDALEISAPTARIAAGAALIAIGVRDMIAGPAQVEPALPGWKAAIVPVVVPHILGPGLGMLAVSAGADLGPERTGVAIGIALAVTASVMALPPPKSRAGARAIRAGHALTGAAAVLIGAALAVDGVFDI